MFSLIRYYYRKASQRPLRNLAILGLDEAGKTTILNNIKVLSGYDPTEPVLPTIGQNWLKMQYKQFQYTVWDLGGQPANRVIWKYYLSELDGFFFVVDAADEARFAESMRELKKLVDDPDLEFCMLVVLANKQDIQGALGADELAARFDLENMLKGRCYTVVETSALPRAGTDAAAKAGQTSSGRSPGVGMDQALDWVYQRFQSDPISRQRTQWRVRRAKEEKDSQAA